MEAEEVLGQNSVQGKQKSEKVGGEERSRKKNEITRGFFVPHVLSLFM